MYTRNWLLTSVFFVVLAISNPSRSEDVSSKQHPLSTGNQVSAGSYEAVGQLTSPFGSCSATLIENDRVLTAAHCVCGTTCTNQATFVLSQVHPVDNPATAIDESASRVDLPIQGRVVVHPEFQLRGWLREDMALVLLQRPVSDIASGVVPIGLGKPSEVPKKGDQLLLVGFGRTGANCSNPPSGKMSLKLKVTDAGPNGILFSHPGRHVCPGDSGGPVINGNGHVVGVASHTDQSVKSTYRATYPHYYWIIGHTVELVALKSAQNGKFVRAGIGTDSLLAAVSTSRQAWEAFRVIHFDGDKIALQSAQNAHYVRAGLGKNTLLGAVSNEIKNWEVFSIKSLKEDTIALRATQNGKFVRAGIGRDSYLGAVSPQIQSWETFAVERIH